MLFQLRLYSNAFRIRRAFGRIIAAFMKPVVDQYMINNRTYLLRPKTQPQTHISAMTHFQVQLRNVQGIPVVPTGIKLFLRVFIFHFSLIS